MKKNDCSKRVGKWSFLSLFVLFLCAGMVNANAQPPKKAGAKKASRYYQLPSGYQQLGNSTLYFRIGDNSFDLLGQFGEYYYSSTYGDYGYSSSFQVDGGSSDWINMVNGTTINGVTGKISMEEWSGLSIIKYTFENTTDEDHLVSTGTRADVMIGDNDRAPIIRRNFPDGQTFGLVMAYDHSENPASLVLLFGEGLNGVDPVDNYWFGYYYINSSAYETAGNYASSGSNYYEENGYYDSGLGWCWKDRLVPAHGTLELSMLIGVGDAALLPQLHQVQLGLVDADAWKNSARTQTLSLSGSYFSPANQQATLYYSVDGGEWTKFLEGVESGSTWNANVSFNFSSTTNPHTLRVMGIDQIGTYTAMTNYEFYDVSTYSLASGLESVTYNGQAQTPAFTLNDVTGATVPTDKYQTEYTNNINAGTANVGAYGIFPNTVGGKLLTFEILPAAINGMLTVTPQENPYTGSEIHPNAVFTDQAFGVLTEGTDYTLTYENAITPGTATVKLTGKGNFKGTASATYTIVKRDVTLQDANYTLPGIVTFDGNRHGVEIISKTEGTGNLTITYTDAEGNVTTEAPMAVGSYIVTFIFEEGAYIKAGTITNVGTITINESEIDNPTGTLQGVVTSSETGLPIASAVITVYVDGKELTAVTDQGGRYSIDLPEANVEYVVKCSAEGYVESPIATILVDGTVVYNFSLNKDDSQVGEDAGLVDGINQTEITGGTAKHYGLGGVRIHDNAKGIHIINGKKYIVK